MARSRNSTAVISVCLLLSLCYHAQSAAAARTLQTLGGDVKSKTKVNTDINGGVDPKYKRVEKVIKKNDLKTQLLLAEAECHATHSTECPKADAIKKQMAASSPPPPSPTVAPCYENVIATYFLGMKCDLPPDSKKDGKYRPAPKKDSGSKSGSRRLLASLQLW